MGVGGEGDEARLYVRYESRPRHRCLILSLVVLLYMYIYSCKTLSFECVCEGKGKESHSRRDDLDHPVETQRLIIHGYKCCGDGAKLIDVNSSIR